MPLFYGADEQVDRTSLRQIFKDLMEEVQKHSSYTGSDVMVMDNVREAYVRTATPPVVSAALLGCWPYLPQSFQTRFLPKFLRFPPTKSITGWLSKSMFCSIQTVAFGSLAAESVAEHAWFHGLQVAVESQTQVGKCITALLSKHQPNSALLKNIPMSAQPLFSSLDSSGPPEQQLPSDRVPPPPSPSASTGQADQPQRRGRGAAATGDVGRVSVTSDEVPEYVLFAMITKQVEARVPAEELRKMDLRRRRRYRSTDEAEAGAAARRGSLEPTPPDAWGGATAYSGAKDGGQGFMTSGASNAVAAPAEGAGSVESGGAGESAIGHRRARSQVPLPPTAEELAKREAEAVWGWSEAGEAAAGGPAADTSSRRRHRAAAASAGTGVWDSGNTTLAGEWSDTFPGDVPRTSEDWSAPDAGAVPGRGRGRGHLGDPVTGGGYVPGGPAHAPRRHHHAQPTGSTGFASDPGLDELKTAPVPHRRHRWQQHGQQSQPAAWGGEAESSGDGNGWYSSR